MVGPWGLEPQTSTVSISIVHRFYNDLQDRGDCQSARKSNKTWVGLWVQNNKMTGSSIHMRFFAALRARL